MAKAVAAGVLGEIGQSAVGPACEFAHDFQIEGKRGFSLGVNPWSLSLTLMSANKPSRRPTLVEQRHAAFAEAVASGATAKGAAILTGYAPGSAHNTGSRLLKDERILAEVERRRSAAMKAAGVSPVDAYEALGMAMSDASPKVRASLVRAAEIVLRASGELAAETLVAVDARSILLPGAANLSVEQLEAMVAALEVGDDTRHTG